MLRALLLKELRELWWAAALACAVIGLQVADVAGLEFDVMKGLNGLRWVPPQRLAPGGFLDVVLLTGYGLAIGYGLWQTFGESLRGTWTVLRYRPIGLCPLLLTKLSAGLGLLLLGTGLPLLLYGLWAAAPGTHASPFAWWMLADVGRVWFSASAVYLAAFLCGLRETRWYGSRFWPLVPALLCPGLLEMRLQILPLGLATFLFDLILLGAVLYAGSRRDY